MTGGPDDGPDDRPDDVPPGPAEPGDSCGGGTYAWDAETGAVTLLAAHDDWDYRDPVIGIGGRVYVRSTPMCADIGMPSLSLVDAATGASTVLLPVDLTVIGSGTMDSFTVGVAG